MSKKTRENAGFTCGHCHQIILPLTNGSYRNHCPFCLYSKHVDLQPGDRLNDCKGMMEPFGIKYKSGKGFQIMHKCIECKTVTVNIIAMNTVQPDNFEKMIQLQTKYSRS
ncbi:MAG TPA: RNHCP domain-containing protein [Bacillales bacterium]|nr:RNHCP domain-containing protein [Bacillales bacterium]